MKKYICDVCGWIYDPEVEILKAVSLQVQHLKTSLMIGFAHFAEQARKTLVLQRNNSTLQKINLQEDSRTLSEKGGNKGGTKLQEEQI